MPDTCERCGYRWTHDPLEAIAHLRTHADVMADPQKRASLDRWEHSHRQFLADQHPTPAWSSEEGD